ncbi:MAG: glycosyltransferase [Candidatus Koribacter versatilis]|uniref:Glycosyltransferase n=1 Tax=Candidatus Korobacter versatilis TaxID=658062 RepID=A0A932A6D3_9BACT|nr:glycosyltransferase [Candidatus Koribacter versatilis]
MAPRIALFHPALSFGGVERVMLNLARGFLARGDAVDYVVANGEGELRQELPEGVRFFDLHSPHVSRSLPGLVRYLRKEQPPVLLAASDHANTIAIWARRLAGVSIRMVISQHAVFSHAHRFAFGLRGRLAVSAARHTYPYADGYIAVSQAVADDLARSIPLPRAAIDVIYNPVITPGLVQQIRQPVEHPWLKPGEPPVVISAGRLYEQKDFATLIRAFDLVRKEQPARLIILGDGPERANLEKLCDESELRDLVALPGFVPDAPAWFARAAVFALSSLWESFSIVLVEAMAAGVPVVSTDCPVGPAELLDGGRYGRLVPIRDAEQMASAIRAAMNEPRTPVPAAALDRFRLDAIVDQYLRVLKGDHSDW